MFHDGMASHAMTLLVTGAFLPGMALALGANNFVIGLLGSLAPMSQMMQIPAILAVEYVGLRKLLTVVFALLSRLSLAAAALMPFFAPDALKAKLFFIFMVIFFVAGSAAGCSWNSWIKDIVPESIRGSYLAKRLSAATALGALLTIVAGFGIDRLQNLIGDESAAFGLIFLLAAAIGFYGVYALCRVHEPPMMRDPEAKNWILTLVAPLKDQNFRKLLAFTTCWSFSVIMAGAFMAVYMLERIGLPMSQVILLAVLSQVTNVYFFKLWGGIADRFSNKSVLAVAVPLFILVMVLYPFTTMPESYTLTMPLLIIIHIFGGISTAGFNLCAANIALKLAPQGKATAYLGANAFCSGLAATIAPILGGAIGTFFTIREISLTLAYTPDYHNPEHFWSIPALSFRGVDFIFFAAALSGLYALHLLSLVEEEGSVNEAEVRDQVYASMRTSLSSVGGLSMGMRKMTAFPYELLKRTTRPTYSIYKSTRENFVNLRKRDIPKKD